MKEVRLLLVHGRYSIYTIMVYIQYHGLYIVSWFIYSIMDDLVDACEGGSLAAGTRQVFYIYYHGLYIVSWFIYSIMVYI